MLIAVTVNKRSFNSIAVKYLLKRYFASARLVIFFVLVLFLGIQYDFKLVLYGVVVYNLYFIVKYLLAYGEFKKLLLKGSGKAEFSLEDFEFGLVLNSISGQKNILWREVERVQRIGGNICLCLIDDSILAIPKEQLSDGINEMEFVEIINKGILKARGTLKVPLFLKPPYFLGIVCFVPIIGVVVSLLLIFLGIFQYKNRILVVMGALGIAFTFIFYSI